MQGRVCLITGPTSGIGRATAHALAEAGAALHLMCRDAARGEALAKELRAAGAVDARVWEADLTRQAAIRSAAAAFLQMGGPLHVLIHNAGVVNLERRETSDGIEETLAVNHLAPFLLTELLRPRLVESAPARVVTVASNAHGFVRGFRADDPEYRRGAYRALTVYGHSKLCNILWTRSLAGQLGGTGVTANCLHPGAVATSLGTNNGRIGRVAMATLRPFFRSPERGARTSVYLATSPEVADTSGAYFIDCRQRRPKPGAEDAVAAKALWSWSERVTGLLPNGCGA
ncbi:SDR family NAD(P)-dependent oxidoreductase [Algiphilus sp.]|uniref:SDR family NAD(P)-dependent oxidoreductase n=1 Tax=Algiphilus sp. TaxID=1872431 RepID=UPI0025BE00A1|nr:SDR family NAD(P)-dependent oxidoreductase [Algiphilus sp.]MCK5769225.1 SDR family NAD(P)-dependent oxidoreductase [Algiphilus sp.]